MGRDHRLLQRQIRKYLGQDLAGDASLQAFLNAVEQSYVHFEEDRALVERAMKISSDELWEKNQQLLRDSERQKILINTLKQAIEQISPELTIQQDIDLLRIADILNNEIRKRRQAEDELLEANRTVEASLKARQNFLMNISHEIRTPLHAIMGMTNLLNQTGATDAQQEYLRVINHSADGLLIIINDLLDLGRMESGKFTLEYIPIHIDDLISNIQKSMSLRASEKSLDFRIHRDPHINSWLICDPTRLQQVLLNLVSNALKFTQRGTVELSLRMEADSPDDQVIRFEVMDTGIGIEPSRLSSIFDQFQQADAGIARKYGGTGLGLSISQSLVEMMGGKIEVYSQLGEGSRFRFTLKVKKGEQQDARRESAFVPEGLEHLRVLIAEDNEINRYLTQSLLSSWGCVVSSVPDGSACVEFLRNNLVDIVLMDLQMPVMDGVSAAVHVRREISTELPIVALTANSVDEELDRCKAAGMNGHLIKPFRPAELYQVIRSVTEVPGMASGRPEITEFDLSRLYELYNHNQDQVDETIRVFLIQFRAEIDQLRLQTSSPDVQFIIRILHRMKSNLELFGMTNLHLRCVALEKDLPAASPATASIRVAAFVSFAQQMLTRIESEHKVGDS